MPHLTLEYTRNLKTFNPAGALAAINQAMFDSGLFGEPDIKSRAIELDTFLIGVSATPRAFAHVRIAMLAGRSSDQRKDLADSVLAALIVAVDGKNESEIQLSVETIDLDRTSYAKAVING